MVSRKAEIVRTAEKLKSVLAMARNAASEAAARYVQDITLEPDGSYWDTCGGAWILIRKPSYCFREALKLLGETDERRVNGYWHVSSFSEFRKGLLNQSYNAAVAIHEAALAVLVQHFPDEPGLTVHSWVD